MKYDDELLLDMLISLLVILIGSFVIGWLVIHGGMWAVAQP